jgi:futalosine hydrolase
MQVLIVAATQQEITKLEAYLQQHTLQTGLSLRTLVTGVGVTHTAYALTKALAHTSYDLVIQAGVAGSFESSIGLGDIVYITKDTFGDLGAEDHAERLDAFDMGLIDPNATPYANAYLVAPELTWFKGLRHVTGLTVHTVSGCEATIAHRKQRYGCDTESMEGAAFHYVCLREGIPFGQVRAISNYVTPRDKSQWKMKEAIANLNNWLIEFVQHL